MNPERNRENNEIQEINQPKQVELTNAEKDEMKRDLEANPPTLDHQGELEQIKGKVDGQDKRQEENKTLTNTEDVKNQDDGENKNSKEDAKTNVDAQNDVGDKNMRLERTESKPELDIERVKGYPKEMLVHENGETRELTKEEVDAIDKKVEEVEKERAEQKAATEKEYAEKLKGVEPDSREYYELQKEKADRLEAIDNEYDKKSDEVEILKDLHKQGDKLKEGSEKGKTSDISVDRDELKTATLEEKEAKAEAGPRETKEDTKPEQGNVQETGEKTEKNRENNNVKETSGGENEKPKLDVEHVADHPKDMLVHENGKTRELTKEEVEAIDKKVEEVEKERAEQKAATEKEYAEKLKGVEPDSREYYALQKEKADKLETIDKEYDKKGDEVEILKDLHEQGDKPKERSEKGKTSDIAIDKDELKLEVPDEKRAEAAAEAMEVNKEAKGEAKPEQDKPQEAKETAGSNHNIIKENSEETKETPTYDVERVKGMPYEMGVHENGELRPLTKEEAEQIGQRMEKAEKEYVAKKAEIEAKIEVKYAKELKEAKPDSSEYYDAQRRKHAEKETQLAALDKEYQKKTNPVEVFYDMKKQEAKREEESEKGKRNDVANGKDALRLSTPEENKPETVAEVKEANKETKGEAKPEQDKSHRAKETTGSKTNIKENSGETKETPTYDVERVKGMPYEMGVHENGKLRPLTKEEAKQIGQRMEKAEKEYAAKKAEIETKIEEKYAKELKEAKPDSPEYYDAQRRKHAEKEMRLAALDKEYNDKMDPVANFYEMKNQKAKGEERSERTQRQDITINTNELEPQRVEEQKQTKVDVSVQNQQDTGRLAKATDIDADTGNKTKMQEIEKKDNIKDNIGDETIKVDNSASDISINSNELKSQLVEEQKQTKADVLVQNKPDVAGKNTIAETTVTPEPGKVPDDAMLVKNGQEIAKKDKTESITERFEVREKELDKSLKIIEDNLTKGIDSGEKVKENLSKLDKQSGEELSSTLSQIKEELNFGCQSLDIATEELSNLKKYDNGEIKEKSSSNGEFESNLKEKTEDKKINAQDIIDKIERYARSYLPKKYQAKFNYCKTLARVAHAEAKYIHQVIKGGGINDQLEANKKGELRVQWQNGKIVGYKDERIEKVIESKEKVEQISGKWAEENKNLPKELFDAQKDVVRDTFTSEIKNLAQDFIGNLANEKLLKEIEVVSGSFERKWKSICDFFNKDERIITTLENKLEGARVSDTTFPKTEKAVSVLSTEVKNDIKEINQKRYDEARQLSQKSDVGRNFTDHTEAHVEQVAEKSLEAANAIEDALEKNNFVEKGDTSDYLKKGDTYIELKGDIDKKTLEAAALCHDTGMAGDGYALKPIFDENGIKKKDIDGKVLYENDENGNYVVERCNKDNFDEVRSNHSLNSALNVLANREHYKKLGYTDEQVDTIAAECMAHSKSNSGVDNLNSKNTWSACFDRIEASVQAYNKDHPDSHIKFDRTIFEQDEQKLGQLATSTLALRIGDVSRDSGPDATSQSGDVVHVDRETVNNEAKSLEDEITNAKVTCGGKEVTNPISKQVHIGEQNIVENRTYIAEDGRLHHQITVNDSNSAPHSTIFSIRDHLGELKTAAGAKFTVDINFNNECSPHAKHEYEKLRHAVKKDYPNVDIQIYYSKDREIK